MRNDFTKGSPFDQAKFTKIRQKLKCRSGKSFASWTFLDKQAVEITAILPQKKLRVLHCLKSMHLSTTLADTWPQCLHDPGSTATTPTRPNDFIFSLLSVYSDCFCGCNDGEKPMKHCEVVCGEAIEAVAKTISLICDTLVEAPINDQ